MDHDDIRGDKEINVVYILSYNKMWEYKIVKSDLWYNVYRKKEKDWILQLRFYSWKDNWTLNKNYAKTFYHKEDAMGALTLIKIKNEKESD